MAASMLRQVLQVRTLVPRLLSPQFHCQSCLSGRPLSPNLPHSVAASSLATGRLGRGDCSAKSPASSQTVIQSGSLLQTCLPFVNSVRSKVRYSIQKGKPKTVKSVVKRFYRLDWGLWIRPRVGRGKRLWRKSNPRIRRLLQHVICNRQQSKLHDKMTTKFWRKKRFYDEDPYEPYQKRFHPEFRDKPRFLP